jgi:hypothetical protein
MPTTEGNDTPSFQESEREKDREYDRDKEKASKHKTSSKGTFNILSCIPLVEVLNGSYNTSQRPFACPLQIF